MRRTLYLFRPLVLLMLAALAVSVVAAVLASHPAQAATSTVTNTNDSGAGSLRQVIIDANVATGEDTINFDPSLSGQTITLGSQLPAISDSAGLTIDGGSANITVSGNNAVRVFDVFPGAKLTLNNLTVANGATAGGTAAGISNHSGTLTVSNSTISDNSSTNASWGGGISNQGGTLTVSNSTISDNSAPSGSGGGISNIDAAYLKVSNSTISGNSSLRDGGGIYFNESGGASTLTVSNSTISDNSTTSGTGGGIYHRNNAGTLTVSNSTISGNSANGDFARGGGISMITGTLTVSNSTISGNSAPSGGGISNSDATTTFRNTIVANSASGGNCQGRGITDGGYNIDDGTSCSFFSITSRPFTNPNLDPNGLQDNGGPTKTIALLTGSPAIDKGNSFTQPTDQRGEVRPCDFVNISNARDGGDGSDIGAFELQGPDCAAPTTTASGFINNADNSTYLSGEWTNQNVTVSLSAADNPGGSGLKEIRYTTDGTDPSASSTLYSAPFPVSSTTTVKYRAQDNAGNVETIKTFEVKIDKTAPSISDQGPTTQPNAADWYKTDVTNAFKATDSGSGLNDACITAFPANQAGDNVQSKTTTGEGAALKVTSDGCTDMAGNAAQGIDSANLKVDKTNPVISRDGVKSGTLGTNNWYTTDVGYGFTAADPDGANGANGSGLALADQAFTRTTSGQGAAIHVSSGTVADLAGNVADAIDSPDFMIDKTAPTVPTGVSAMAVASPVVTWTPSTDSVGVTKYNIKRSTTLGGTYTTVGSVTGTPPTASFTDSTAGPSTTYYYKVNAEDAATNTSADSSASSPITTPGTSDTTAPTLTSTSPSAPNGTIGTMLNRSDNVTATFSEEVKNVNATTFKLEKVTLNKKGVETTSPVAATVTPASGTVAQGASATLNPSKDLQRGSTYRATLTNGVTDTAGNPLATYSWKFKVN